MSAAVATAAAAEDASTPASIIIDNGTGTIKAGFSGEERPSAVFPTFIKTESEDGKESETTIKYPIEYGVITDFESMQTLWQKTFDENLKVPSLKSIEKHSIVLSEPVLNPKFCREEMTGIMFEKFGMDEMYVGIAEVLSLYACGKTAGMVVGAGHGVCHVVPIHEARAIPRYCRMDFGGHDLTVYLMKLLNDKGVSFDSIQQGMSIVKDIKEKMCFVSQNFKSDLAKCMGDSSGDISSEFDRKFALPDGSLIKLGSERFRCAEVLFDPSLIGKYSSSIDEITNHSIQRCDEEIRTQLYSNIILCGGSTLFPGLAERLTRGITAKAPASTKITVVSPPERKYSVWIGGSILSSLSTFSEMCISKTEFEEHGAAIVTKKLPVS